MTAFWLAQGESRLPWSFEYEIVAREGDLYVVRAKTQLPPGNARRRGAEVFHNLWLVTLDGDGRVREFVEYFMQAE